MSARCVMVLGTTSGAGKSLLATALCRWYADQGLRVRPFKAQNMSNNARVVACEDGSPGEIGSAQYFQALAARATPDVRMNPVLLKPEADTRSQVVLLGRMQPALSTMPWHARSEVVWPAARDALHALRAEADVVVIEGAGSPAEINLAHSDYVNGRTAVEAEAAALLVCDIDRGGAFAHLFGTHALMPAEVRTLLRGFVLNKFRGDASLLAPAPEQLQALTGVPTLAVLPMLREHGLPEEDGVDPRHDLRPEGTRTIAIVAAPHLSNLDEFEPLRHLPGWRLRWARDAATIAQADWLILPGSKHTRADLQWLRAEGRAAAVLAHVAQGRPLLAICGGLQMLGEAVDDPLGIEGEAGRSEGLAVLPLTTRLAAHKQLQAAAHRFGPLCGAWQPWSGLAATGYEIHVGESRLSRNTDEVQPLPNGLGWQRGNVLGTYLHGLFENRALVQALFGDAPPPLEASFDRLAATIEQHFTSRVLMQLLDPRP
jgi:adenosylcobyric acid synthase